MQGYPFVLNAQVEYLGDTDMTVTMTARPKG
jgi:hypothetical protein